MKPKIMVRVRQHTTMMIFDARMGGHMPTQIAGGQKAFVAHATNLISYADVDFLMRLEIAERCKLL